MNVILIALLTAITSIISFGQAVKDESLTQKLYKKKGMPDPDMVWHSAEYDKSIVILSELKQQNIHSLPKANSKKSGRYFKRFVASQNLLIINDTTVDFQNRMAEMQYFSGNLGRMIFLYIQDTEGKQYYGTEVIDIFIFGLNLNQATIDWGNAILGTTKEMNSQMQAGFQTMKNGYRSTLTGLLMELEIEGSYDVVDRETLSTEIKKNIVRNVSWLDPQAKTELKERLIRMTEKEPSAIIKGDFAEIIALL